MNWRERAACRGMALETFHPGRTEPDTGTAEAKAACAGCQVRAECLGAALRQSELYGVWGGMSVTERARLRRVLRDDPRWRHLPDDAPPPHPARPSLKRAERRRILVEHVAEHGPIRRGEGVKLAERFGVDKASISLDLKWLRQQGRLLALEVASATAGVLADPSDLTAYVSAADLVDDDGNPDAGKITAAATELASRKPHLAPRLGPTGDVDQGARAPGPETFDLAGALRAAAG
ncbi:MAG: WhiB family transcriptional regulator [Acidimicrobiales bacterium]